MKKTICFCDRCGKEIKDGIVYTLTCYAQSVKPRTYGEPREAVEHNIRQNTILAAGEADLCKECKDKLTDGIFIV